jgi:MerR family transcriptional regulator, light-induced transcriptional regulator
VIEGREDDAARRHEQLAEELQRTYADALLAGAPRRAEAVIREAIELGLGEAEIDDLVIAPALRLVGDLWADGRLSIAQEHLASAISLRVMTLQREAFRAARRRVTHRVLLAGAEGELHVVGLSMAASLLLGAGYDVRMLGADLPVGELDAALMTHDPVVVGFTTATPLTSVHLPRAFDVVRARNPDTSILVGGAGADPQWMAGHGVVICDHVADAVAHVDALVQRAPHN